MKLWFQLTSNGTPPPNEKGFEDKNVVENFQVLENNHSIIKQEILTFIEENQQLVKPYFNQDLVPKPKTWKSFSFQFWGWKVGSNCNKCPRTVELLKSIPNLVSASVSILEPGAIINRHRGDTNAVYRCHLGLLVPAGLPEIGFKCSDETRDWKEGEFLVFNDSSIHEVWNQTDSRRIVLLLDVMKPEFKGKKHYVCSRIISSLIIQKIYQSIFIFKYLPKVTLVPVYILLVLGFYPVLRFSSKISS